MRKLILIFILTILMTSTAMATIETTDITTQTTQPNTRLVTLLRDKFDKANLDIAAVTGLYNIGTGNAYWVDSGAGSDSYTGTRKEWAKATLDAGVGLCSDNNGDVVYVLQNHGENFSAADAADLDVPGITIVNLGEGDDKPTYTYTAAAGELVFGAANIVFYGGRLVPATDTVTMGVSVEGGGDNCLIIGTEFPEPSTASNCFVDAIDLADGADGVGIYFVTYRHVSVTGPEHFVEMGNGVNKDFRMIGCDIAGEFSVAAVWSDTADWWTVIANNKIANLTSGEHCIEFTAAAEGVICNNDCYGDTEGSIIDPGSMFEFNNKKCVATGTPAYPDWVISTDLNHLIEDATSDTSDPVDLTPEVPDHTILSHILAKSGDTSNFVSTTDSLEMLSDKLGGYSGDGGAAQDDSVKASMDLAHTDLDAIITDFTNSGTFITIEASVTSSNIKSNTQTSSAITGAASGTLLLIEISINTDGTGLAGPTNFEFSVDNTYGDTGADDPIAVEAAGGLGASISWVCSDDATSHQLPIQIESGAKIYLHGDDSAGTGAGVAQITMRFQRVTDGATIAANDGPS